VFFYHSAVGGCCDCGDADAWDSKGFCSCHGKKTENPVQFIPRDIVQVSVVIFDTIVENLLKYAQYVAGLYDLDAHRRVRPGEEDVCNLVLVYDEFQTPDKFAVLLRHAEPPLTSTYYAIVVVCCMLHVV
jgi:hypothetical protein